MQERSWLFPSTITHIARKGECMTNNGSSSIKDHQVVSREEWLSSFHSDFNFDYQASFTPEEVKSGAAFFNYARTDPGMMDRESISVFYKDESGAIFHTYSCYARGIDMMNATYQYLDLVPKGRDEQGLEEPQAWVRYHDRYED